MNQFKVGLELFQAHLPSHNLYRLPFSKRYALQSAFDELSSLLAHKATLFTEEGLLARLQTVKNASDRESALLDEAEYGRQGFSLTEDGRKRGAELARKVCTTSDFPPLDVLQALTSAEVGLLAGFRQTPGSTSVKGLSLGHLIFACTELHDFQEDRYLRYVDRVKTGCKARGAPNLLTVAGRALAKHAQRDVSSSWWDVAQGPRDRINSLANAKLATIVDDNVWMNLHTLPHNTQAFEIRCSKGYGARWVLCDGQVSFRGFLEPHSQDGHAQGWKY